MKAWRDMLLLQQISPAYLQESDIALGMVPIEEPKAA
jgi:hypothetical protein